MNDELIVHSVAPDHGLGEWRNVVVFIWRGHVQLATAARCRRVGLAIIHRFPRAGAAMHVVEPTAAVPDDQVRKAVAIESDEQESGVAAIIAEGSGLRAAVVRSVGTGVSLLMRRKLLLRVFSRVPEGATWLAGESGRRGAPATGSELAAAIEALRAKIPHA